MREAEDSAVQRRVKVARLVITGLVATDIALNAFHTRHPRTRAGISGFDEVNSHGFLAPRPGLPFFAQSHGPTRKFRFTHQQRSPHPDDVRMPSPNVSPCLSTCDPQS